MVPVVRGTLKTGDYSIQGFEDQITVERKSPEDLIKTISHGRERFIRELQRMEALDRAFVIVEAEWGPTLKMCRDFTGFNPRSLDSSILSWQLKYPGVQWIWRPDKFCAAKTCWKIFDLFWRQNARAEES